MRFKSPHLVGRRLQLCNTTTQSQAASFVKLTDSTTFKQTGHDVCR